MQEQRFHELEARASQVGEADAVKKLETQAHVAAVIELMREEGKVLVLTSEEEEQLRAFRRFKESVRRNGEVFRWQTRREEVKQPQEQQVA